MSLLKPSPGEICDRLTIIALKQESGNRAEWLEEEAQSLLALLNERYHRCLVQSLRLERMVASLGAVNGLIWHGEDQVRRLGAAQKNTFANAYDELIAVAAVRVRELADRRHYLIADIDRLFGEARAGKDKSWMKGEGGA